jgi:hypothetical protein
MILSKKTITAITRRIWINDPSTWNPKNPTNHKMTSTVAIVVSIYVIDYVNGE